MASPTPHLEMKAIQCKCLGYGRTGLAEATQFSLLRRPASPNCPATRGPSYLAILLVAKRYSDQERRLGRTAGRERGQRFQRGEFTPRDNAFAERWIGKLRRKSLDRLLICSKVRRFVTANITIGLSNRRPGHSSGKGNVAARSDATAVHETINLSARGHLILIYPSCPYAT
jgi:hypothetical protein